MDNMTRNAVHSLIGAREDAVLRHLENNLDYQEICHQQEKSEKIVEQLYRCFEKTDRITIRRHYEGEMHKTNVEIKEAYMQGLRDCFRLFGYLSGNEVRI